jgi:hypothetical protein
MLDVTEAFCPPGADVLELHAPGGRHWLFPTNNPRVRWSSFGLYPAHRLRGRAYRTLLRVWLTLGGGGYTHRVVRKRTAGWPLGDLLLPDMPTLSTAAVYMGNPGPDRKITVQLMDDGGSVLGYAKYADRDRPRSLIANEARMLETIPEGVGPGLVRFAPFLQGDLLVQTRLPGRTRMPRLPRHYRAHMRFLERLIQSGGTYPISEHPFVASLYARAGARRGMLEKVVLGLGDSEWPVAFMHGDLSPANMHWWHGHYLAFDWEYGMDTGLAYLEAPHPLIEFASLIRGTDPQIAKRTISGTLSTYLLPFRYKKLAPQVAALAALNMLISWYPPRDPDAYERWLTAFVKADGTP